MEKNFKNSFGVKGSPALIKAFAVEVELLGWKFDANGSSKSKSDIGVDPPNLWFCAYNNKALDLRPNHYWCDRGGSAQYILPQDWDKALKAASEIVEEIPEYVECVNSNSPDYWTKGKIYKLDAKQSDYPNRIDLISNKHQANVVNWQSDLCPRNNCFKPSTKEAYDAQNKPVFKVGDWVYDAISCTVQQIKATDHNGADLHIQGWTYLNQLRKATPEEIAEVTKPKFKVGDWVKRTWKDGDVDTFKIEDISKTHYGYSHYTRIPYVGLLSEGSCQISDDRFTDELIPAPKTVVNSTTLTLGTSKIKITIYKNGAVEAEGKSGTIKMVKQLIDGMQRGQSVSGWEITYPNIKIGCSTFTLNELKQIVTAHDKLNELEW